MYIYYWLESHGGKADLECNS